MWEYLLKLMIAIPVLGFSLVAFLKWTQRQHLFASRKTYLALKEGLKVSPKATLQLIQVGSDYLLLAVTDQAVTVLKEIAAEEVDQWEVGQDAVETTEEHSLVQFNLNHLKLNQEQINQWKTACQKFLKQK